MPQQSTRVMPISSTERRLSVIPPFLSEGKNEGPTCTPSEQIKSTNPKFCAKVSIVESTRNPKCAARMPTKNTKVIPRDILPIFIFASISPMAQTRQMAIMVCMSDGVQKTSLIQSIIAQKGMSFAQPPNMGRGRFAYIPIKEPTSRPLFCRVQRSVMLCKYHIAKGTANLCLCNFRLQCATIGCPRVRPTPS